MIREHATWAIARIRTKANANLDPRTVAISGDEGISALPERYTE